MTVASRISKWFFYLLLLPAMIGICGWQGWAWWSWATAPMVEASASGADQNNGLQIKIPSGSTAQEIGATLESAGLIRSLTAWNLWTRWQTLQNREGSFQAGTYELSSTESLPQIADKIWQGEVVQRSFTVPEGWSIREMAAYFEEQGFFSADEFIAETQQVPRDQFPWLPEGVSQLEGFLYPDTYTVAGEVTAQSVVDQMLDRFQQVALPIYEAGQDKTPYTFQEWVTLASIVEKEAVVSQERPQIASVFAKRLKEGMPLGADPTVEYALGIRQTADQPLTYNQVNTPSPYNTYVNAGLPPTPIASPGVASLEASLVPAETDYLYFVARYDGTHVFSRTLVEHEAAQNSIHDQRAAQSETRSDTTN